MNVTKMNVSVCIATYNGSDYIVEQLESIICQLDKNDEIIIVDDCSTDETINIVKSLNDNRIRIYKNPENVGHVKTFSNAVKHSTKEIILLSDQDDIWIKNRLKVIKDRIKNLASPVLFSNFELFYSDGSIALPKPLLLEKDSTKYLKNVLGIFIGNRNYFGCSAAFKRDIIKIFLPIPNFVEAHDLWLALIGNITGTIIHVEEKTLSRRIHSKNLTNSNRSFLKKIKTRFIHILSIIIIVKRIIKNSSKL